MSKARIFFCLLLLPGVAFAQSKKEITPVVKDALAATAKGADARAASRQQELKDASAKFGPMAEEVVKRLRAAGVGVDGFLAASKQFVETPIAKQSEKGVEVVNSKYAGPIQKGLAAALGLSGTAAVLQEVQHRSSASGPPPPGPPAPCCSRITSQPPFEGLFTEGDLGSRSITPGVPVTQLEPSVRSAILAAPHRLISTGKDITVPATACHVRVDLALDTSWVIGLSGIGYSHVWLGLDMNVTKPGGSAACSAPHLEQDNQWTWLGGVLTLTDHRPGPRIVQSCEFDRNPTDPTTFSANVTASADGTFVGFSGGFGDYLVKLGQVDVSWCPCASN
jgi:hypothetical protein